MASNLWLGIEFTCLFILIPTLLYFRLFPAPPIPILIAVGLAAYLYLRYDRGFGVGRFWNAESAAANWVPVVARTLLMLLVLGMAVAYFRRDLLFALVKRSPVFWAVIMVGYPILSVYPQELIYRAFFFERYAPLFRTELALIIGSALAFAYVHIVFGNWLSVLLTLIGGFLFAHTYSQTHSLLLVSIEHALFGDFIFTIGLGQFFYHGARA